jgi:hypothetical protein
MKCGIEIIVGVILRKPVVKVEISAFLVAILTLTAGDALRVAKLVSCVGWSNHPQMLFRGGSTTPKTH